MKKIIVAALLISLSANVYSQNCEEREAKMLGIMGTFSAGFLYNTYGLIGSISDGYEHNAYDEQMVSNLLDAQKKLADNMTGQLEKIIAANAFKDAVDKNYMLSAVAIIKGLKTQAELLIDLTRNKSQKNINAYDNQRKKNWKDLAKLMGIPE
jgi:ABC-type microcin C transport system permease subunit YejB